MSWDIKKGCPPEINGAVYQIPNRIGFDRVVYRGGFWWWFKTGMEDVPIVGGYYSGPEPAEWISQVSSSS